MRVQFEMGDIVMCKEFGDYAQIEQCTTTHGRIAYILSHSNCEYFPEEIELVCKNKNRLDDWHRK